MRGIDLGEGFGFLPLSGEGMLRGFLLGQKGLVSGVSWLVSGVV